MRTFLIAWDTSPQHRGSDLPEIFQTARIFHPAAWRSVQWRERLHDAKGFLLTIYEELFRTRAFTVAAAMAFYFLLSLVPLLIFCAALLGYLPIPHIFDQLLDVLATFVPADAMALVEKIVAGVLAPHRGGFLSFGLLGYLWSVTGGFVATIEALNIAYDVVQERSWWRDRLQALLLTFTSGALSLVSLVSLIVGPEFGHFLTTLFPIPRSFARMWPTLGFSLTFVSFVLGIELLYYLGPNRKQRFASTLPGAIIAVVGWFAGSAVLRFYLNHFANYSKTYGSLGAVVGLMLWFYLIAVAILIGAEWNAELAKRRERRRLGHRSNPFDQPIPGVPAA